MNNLIKHIRSTNRILFITWFIVISLVLSLFLSTEAEAQAVDKGNVSVTFVIDNSGSMKSNDHQNLRLTAVKLFVALLDYGDGASIITFSTESDIKARFTLIESKDDKLHLMRALDDSRSEGFTHMKAAFEDVLEVLKEDQTSNNKIVIFLTDGQPEMPGGLPPNYEEYTLDAISKAGVPVISIGLTSGGMSSFLGRIPGIAAEGSKVIPVKTANELLDVYLGILGQLKDRTIVGSGNISAPDVAELSIDPGLAQYVERVSFVAVGASTIRPKLLSPHGNELSPDESVFSETFVDPSFTVLTMDAPLGGDWAMQLQGSGVGQARAILRSKLRVRILQPQSIAPAGEPMLIVANLIVEDPPRGPIVSIGDVSFSAYIEGPHGSREILDILYDDGTRGDLIAGDGAFTNTYVNTNMPGTYHIYVTGYKGIIPVVGQAWVEVVEFPKLQILSPTPAKTEVRGPMEIRVELQGGDPPEFDQGSVVASIKQPDGSFLDEIVLEKNGVFYSGAFILVQNGKHILDITTKNVTYKSIPYTPNAQMVADVVVVPSISIIPIDRMPGEAIDLGKLINLEDTHQISLRVNSTSRYEEKINISLRNLPGGHIEPQEIMLEPMADKIIVLNLRSDARLAPNTYEPLLLFNSRSSVDMATKEIPVTFEIVSVRIRLTPEIVNLNDILKLGSETTANIRADSNSPFPVTLSVVSVEPANIKVQLEPQVVNSDGETNIKLKISSPTELKPGTYKVRVKLTTDDPMVVLEPEVIEINWRIPSLLERFGAWGGLLLIGLVSVAGAAYTAIPSPRGQLREIVVPQGQTPKTYYLIKYVTLKKGYNKRVTLGSANSDIILKDSSLGKPHAYIRAEKRTITRTIGKGNKQKIQKIKRNVSVIYPFPSKHISVNNVSVPTTGVPLSPNCDVTIGDYKFQYK
jgi:hypothetical protein